MIKIIVLFASKSTTKMTTGSWLIVNFFVFCLILGVLKSVLEERKKSNAIKEAKRLLKNRNPHKTSFLKKIYANRNHIEQYDIQKELCSIDYMSGREFEFWCADLLRRVGMTEVYVTPQSNDQGADIIAYNGGDKCAIQCKCYSSSLGNKPIQQVHAAKSYYRCYMAYVMTNSQFTKGAIDAAKATGVRLIDRAELIVYMKEANRRSWLSSRAYKKSVRKAKRQERKLKKQTK